jgi:hypothetical protein
LTRGARVDSLPATNHSLFTTHLSRMAKREVDKRKTRKALRKLRRAAERAVDEGGPGLTAWEKDFVEGVSGRLEKYGSAFRDPGKGRLEEALSQRQAQVARVIDRKSRKTKTGEAGKAAKTPLKRSAMKRKTPLRSRSAARVCDVNEDLETSGPLESSPPRKTPAENRAALRVIPGGKDG